jgi:ATP-binding cassette subfamily F protein 3
LIFVSHNRAFVRRLATRIWNVADGTVETYPGTLDEYMDTCRLRQLAADGSTAATAAAAKKASAPAAAPKPAQAQSAGKPASTSGNGASAPHVDAKKREAEKRSKNRQQKLEREVADLETKIGEIETAQKQRSELLADPAVYADKERSTKLLGEFKDGQRDLEALTKKWESVQSELEGLS